MKEVAIKLIDTFGGFCKPDNVNKFGTTALIWACCNSMKEVAIKLIDTFGELCKPEQVDENGYTANMFLRKNNMYEVISKFFNKFKTSPESNYSKCKRARLQY
jgi:hypothetical protein